MRDILERLLAFDTVSSRPNMALMTYVKGLLEEAGLAVTLVPDAEGGKANLYASTGPAGLSRLSVWWTTLGIQVEFIRPGHPEENGAHEQMHRVFKAETTRPPAPTRQGQQHRTTSWIRTYNHLRPHEALGQEVPASRYRKSSRRLARQRRVLNYPAGWPQRQVRSNGEIRWRGRRRFVGEAFIRQRLGLKPLSATVQAVYFGSLLIGHLHDGDPGAMRPAVYLRRRTTATKSKV